jgi:hypothetical protein
MESIEMSRKPSQNIINDFIDVRLASRSLLHKRIKESYKVESLFVNMPAHERYACYLNTLRLNAEKIAHIYLYCMTGTMMAGGVIGAIVGSLTVNPFGVAACSGMGVGTGAGVGAIIGTSICVAEECWYEEKMLEFHVLTSEKYEELIKDVTLEHYEIFLDFIKYYIEYIPEEQIDSLDDFICSITYTIPKEPVFSPHDLQRAHVYEKSAIELHLGIVEARILDAKENDYPLEQIKSIEDTADPFRGPYFRKEELIFDIGHVGKSIKFLRKIQKQIPDCDDVSKDPRLAKILVALILHYSKMYKKSTAATVNAMMSDMLAIGVQPETVLFIGKKFDEQFRKQQEIIVEKNIQEDVDISTQDLMASVLSEFQPKV